MVLVELVEVLCAPVGGAGLCGARCVSGEAPSTLERPVPRLAECILAWLQESRNQDCIPFDFRKETQRRPGGPEGISRQISGESVET